MNNPLPNISADWFKDWFDEWYLIVYKHRDQHEAAEFIERWLIWDELSDGDRCLDLGCGTGRYIGKLVQRGLEVLGLDLSMALLRVALNNPEQMVNRNFVRADIRMLPTNLQFSLIVSLFTSFGYFKTDEEHLDLMKNIGARMKPRGYLILDLPNPESTFIFVTRNPENVRTIDSVVIKEKRWIDYRGGRVLKKITIAGDSTLRTYFESVRLFRRDEIEYMLNCSDLKLSYIWGDYQGGQFNPDSPRMIFFGKKIG